MERNARQVLHAFFVSTFDASFHLRLRPAALPFREPPTCARGMKSSRELAVGCEGGHISVFRVGGPRDPRAAAFAAAELCD